MRIAIVHNAVDKDSRIDDQDVLVQADAVFHSLTELGHQVITLACTLDLAEIKQKLISIQPDMVFNLVESLDGDGRLIHLFPALLDSMGLLYTGSRTEAIWITSHKVLAKEKMISSEIPTPPWWGPEPSDIPLLHPSFSFEKIDQWLVKSVWEHGSFGLDNDNPIKKTTSAALTQILRKRAPGLGKACFAEAFIPGREFNLSLLNDANGPEVLPPAEILFENFGPDRLPIVGYRAKWDDLSYEYGHTPRRFDFPSSDKMLLKRLQTIAIQCWQAFGLSGYARVDFRVDSQGLPCVLEVNVNPCLSPDAGFSAAVTQGGMTYTEAISRIVMTAQMNV